jgi:3',5'-cyclic AMP phosphodiesterase CpdA
MRTLVHLSDLHFGRIDPAIVEPLRRAVVELKPDLVAISGDFTQRARRSQFAAARAFIASLNAKTLVVPGNHDIPLYDVVSRLVAPLDYYRRYISSDLEPEYQDEEMIVLGVNTARALVFPFG